MIPISEILGQKKAFILGEDEYLKDGILTCKKCHTARYASMTINDQFFESRVLCRCQTEERDREEEQERLRKLRQQIERNRSDGLPDVLLRKHTFANDLGYNPKPMQIAKNYCKHFDEFRKDGTGLLLWGDVGTGKSFIAGCIANELLDKGKRVLMTNFSRLLNRLTDLRTGDRNGYIDSLNRFEVLIIDDFGVERNSEFAREQTFGIIDSRYRSGKPMIVTTNLSMQELKNPTELWQKRIYDRVLERCAFVLVNEQKVRMLNAASANAEVKKLLQE